MATMQAPNEELTRRGFRIVLGPMSRSPNKALISTQSINQTA
jgi:hypothetical protein